MNLVYHYFGHQFARPGGKIRQKAISLAPEHWEGYGMAGLYSLVQAHASMLNRYDRPVELTKETIKNS